VSVVPEVSHFIMMEEPETFNRLLTQAIEQLQLG
jgi:pimeloyl-ACP methyl ester carboxylesterase